MTVPLSVKRGFQFGQDFERSVGAREFVGVEDEGLRRGFGGGLRFGRGAVAVGERGDFYFDGDGFVLEVAGGDGGEGFFVGVGGELIGLLAGDSEFARDIFRAEAHVDVGVRIVIDEPGIRGNFVAAHGNQGHRFGAAGDDDFRGAAANAFGSERDRLQAGRAETVDGHRGGFDGKSGAKSGDARDVHALLAFGHGAAEDHVVDFLGVESGHAGERFLDGQRGKIVGPRGAQRALVGPADGRADGRNDDGFRHGRLPPGPVKGPLERVLFAAVWKKANA